MVQAASEKNYIGGREVVFLDGAWMGDMEAGLFERGW